VVNLTVLLLQYICKYFLNLPNFYKVDLHEVVKKNLILCCYISKLEGLGWWGVAAIT
jgi:hypothetical protein